MFLLSTCLHVAEDLDGLGAHPGAVGVDEILSGCGHPDLLQLVAGSGCWKKTNSDVIWPQLSEVGEKM